MKTYNLTINYSDMLKLAKLLPIKGDMPDMDTIIQFYGILAPIVYEKLDRIQQRTEYTKKRYHDS